MSLVTYRHGSAGFTLPLPANWERTEDERGIALIAAEPEREPWFRTNVVVTIEHLAEGLDLAGWQDTAGAQLARSLADYLLLDLEDTELGGRPAVRRLAHHATEVGAVTCEQWTLVEGRLGYSLTASVGTLEYADRADLFGQMAQQFQPDPRLVG